MSAFDIAYYMNIGIRETQEDSIFLNGKVVQECSVSAMHIERIDSRVIVCAVCDGMGGLRHGEWASRFVCEKLGEKLCDVAAPGEAVPVILKDIQREMEGKEIEDTGTTIAGVVIEGDRTTVFNAGDSRVYKIMNNSMICLSHDHSLVQDEIDRGNLSAEEASVHPYRNAIKFGLGSVFRTAWGSGDNEVYLAKDVLRQPEFYLVCSDGLYDILQEEEICTMLSTDPFDKLPEIIRCITERMNDNVSFILIGNARCFGKDSINPAIEGYGSYAD